MLASALLAVLAASASAGGLPKPVGPEFSAANLVAEVSVPGFGDGCPIESADGLSLIIASNRPGTTGANDIGARSWFPSAVLDTWRCSRSRMTAPSR